MSSDKQPIDSPNDMRPVSREHLLCPITGQLMIDPVFAKDGRCYEKEAIEKWIDQKGNSPFTRQPLNGNDLQPCRPVRHMIETHFGDERDRVIQERKKNKEKFFQQKIRDFLNSSASLSLSNYPIPVQNYLIDLPSDVRQLFLSFYRKSASMSMRHGYRSCCRIIAVCFAACMVLIETKNSSTGLLLNPIVPPSCYKNINSLNKIC
jgi:hypothetical protein